MIKNVSKEFTPFSILLGILLSIVMGAANVYLGLKVGMTVSASIPAAVIALGILRGVFRRKSILEANLVQTAASAGESLAAGVIFTMPALLIVGIWSEFDFWTTTLVSMTGGLLGILFMIPMRKVFIVDSQELKFPEGIACAEILKAGDAEGEDSQADLKMLFNAVGIGALVQFGKKFLHIFSGSVEKGFFTGQRIFVFGFDVSPALIGVGYIVGLPVAMQVFLGGCIGWFLAIPFMEVTSLDGGSVIDKAYGLWSSEVRYIGVGAMIVGGIESILKVRHSITSAVKELFKQLKQSTENVAETERNIPGSVIGLLAIACLITIGCVYYQSLNNHLPITILTTLFVFFAAFFFTAVASYIVGLVGNSNSPVSGMTISAVLLICSMLYLFGYTGSQGIVATLVVAGVVCCVCCTAGDVCNDLKTGQIIGASPRKQQWMQIIGVISASVIMSPVLMALHQGSINAGTGGIGGKDLAAPQAGLFASLAEGFFGDGQLNWNMIAIGAVIAILIFVVDKVLQSKKSSTRLYIMPVAVGIYLPVGISVPMMLGGLIHHFVTREKKDHKGVKKGVLISSGLIAGESLMGVGLAIFAYYNVLGPKYLGHGIQEFLATICTILVAAWIYKRSKRS